MEETLNAPQGADRWVRDITGAIAVVAIAGVLLGAGVIVMDVLGKWVFNKNVFALNEIMSLVFAMAVAATFPAGAANRVNLRIDLLAPITGLRMTAWLTVLGSVVLLCFYLMLAWSIWGLGLRYSDQGRATALLEVPLAPAYFVISVAMWASSAVQVFNLVEDTRKALATPRGRGTGGVVIALIILFAALCLGIFYWTMTDMGSLTNFMFTSPGLAVLIAFALLWLGVFLQIPLASVTAMIGVVGALTVLGPNAAMNTFGGDSADFLRNDQVATLPLFLIMGAFSVAAGVSHDLFRLGHALLGPFRGGLAYATIAACAGFGAVSGNSVVTSATFGRMALPEMQKLGYAPTLATATVAAGGTLGALVPPSGVIILFALLTEESIGALFVAAMLPAALAILLYIGAVFATVSLSKETVPAAAPVPLSEIRSAFIAAGPVVGMFAVVIGGLYSGLFTVTESAAVGAVCAFLLAIFRGRLNRATLLRVFSETTTTVAMIYALIFGGLMFAFFVNLSGAPDLVANWVSGIDAKPVLILALLVVIYLLLGSVMDSFGVMIITLPVVTPIILHMGYDMLFWGVLMLVVVEIGMITPPFGMNLFIIKNIDPKISLTTVMKGVFPFIIADLVKIILIIAFPALSLWLPSTMN
ncbi:TRAP transporter large permease subunit [Maritimibacter dapengensis]|uniref:TRAP transporter large permease subunit n=1 Tax=Maritimibacter dapengensis TaxID=2836868 RepID=A0ABS6T076_9RHOB|nr:TRAP transporter large permease subunit [Maritimibacter dapengensis]MBV7378509.1 TRAP transporter large permease subunit [Maritimibacter dapengensis]